MRTLYIDACNHLHPGPPTASQLQAYLQVDRGPCCGSEAQSCSPPSPAILTSPGSHCHVRKDLWQSSLLLHLEEEGSDPKTNIEERRH